MSQQLVELTRKIFKFSSKRHSVTEIVFLISIKSMSHIVLSGNRLRLDNKWRIKYESLKESCSVKSPDCPLNYCGWQRDNWARRNIFVGVSNVAVFIFFSRHRTPSLFGSLFLFSSGLKVFNCTQRRCRSEQKSVTFLYLYLP